MTRGFLKQVPGTGHFEAVWLLPAPARRKSLLLLQSHAYQRDLSSSFDLVSCQAPAQLDLRSILSWSRNTLQAFQHSYPEAKGMVAAHVRLMDGLRSELQSTDATGSDEHTPVHPANKATKLQKVHTSLRHAFASQEKPSVASSSLRKERPATFDKSVQLIMISSLRYS